MGKTIKKESWNFYAWLWVLLCTIGIFSTVPLARKIQKLVYTFIGKEFFTYTVLFVVITGLIILIYFLWFKLKTKEISQYIWLSACAGGFIYYTYTLRRFPEEALHLLEYAFLSFLIYNALKYRIKDNTIYISTVFCVLFIGTLDEFLQWLTPARYWGLHDVQINSLAAVMMQLAIWKGIKPQTINRSVSKYSIRMLAAIITVSILFLGLCLSNTPEAVRKYTSYSAALLWLNNEEPMTEYGYMHYDPATGYFNSRLSLNEIKSTDLSLGDKYGRTALENLKERNDPDGFINPYKADLNPFLYEFTVHLNRRDENIALLESDDSKNKIEMISTIILKENEILKQYFRNTLKHSHSQPMDVNIEELFKLSAQWDGEYISHTGQFITALTLKTVWALIILILIALRLSVKLITPHLKED